MSWPHATSGPPPLGHEPRCANCRREGRAGTGIGSVPRSARRYGSALARRRSRSRSTSTGRPSVPPSLWTRSCCSASASGARRSTAARSTSAAACSSPSRSRATCCLAWPVRRQASRATAAPTLVNPSCQRSLEHGLDHGIDGARRSAFVAAVPPLPATRLLLAHVNSLPALAAARALDRLPPVCGAARPVAAAEVNAGGVTVQSSLIAPQVVQHVRVYCRTASRP